MSVSILNTPISLEPINAPLWFRVNSASSTATDFKYIFIPQYKIEPFASTAYTTIGTYRIPPRPVNGDGLFSPHRALKSFLQTNIDPFVSTTVLSAELASLIAYKMNYGFELNPNLIFTDTINVSGNMGLTFSVVHSFLVGDIITVNKDNKSVNPQYDGTCSVVSIVSTRSIKTDKPFSSTLLANESGVITNQYRITGSSSEFYTWNATRQYTERTKDFRQYIIATSSIANNGKFLTNYDLSIQKPVRLDDYETLSMILPSSPLNPYYVYVNTYTSANTLIGTYGLTYSSANGFRKVDIGVGPMNLINMGIPFVNSNTGLNVVDRYEVYVKNTGSLFANNVSEVRKYKINNKCSNYEKQRIVFLNRLGGYDYFNFTLDSKRTLGITRTEYEKMLDWNYNVGDRGKTILAQKAEIKMTMTSDWITENDAIWLEELMTSPEVFLMSNSNVVYENRGPIMLPATGPNYFTIPTAELPAGTYNIQFDVILKDDLLIDAVDLTSLDVVPKGIGTLHYAKKLTTTGGLVFTNIVNYDDDIIITNLIITRTTGDKLPIIITDNSYEVKTALRNQLFNLVLNYKFGYDLNLQNE
jgi:hypothetical protein